MGERELVGWMKISEVRKFIGGMRAALESSFLRLFSGKKVLEIPKRFLV